MTQTLKITPIIWRITALPDKSRGLEKETLLLYANNYVEAEDKALKMFPYHSQFTILNIGAGGNT